MSAPEKRMANSELEAIEDAFVQTILDMDGKALREELATAGLDPHHFIAETDNTIARAKLACAKQRLEIARTELAEFRARNQNPTAEEREAARVRLDRTRSRDKELASKMMMAARKGEEPSERDLEGLVEDIAQLHRLEGEDGEP